MASDFRKSLIKINHLNSRFGADSKIPINLSFQILPLKKAEIAMIFFEKLEITAIFGYYSLLIGVNGKVL